MATLIRKDSPIAKYNPVRLFGHLESQFGIKVLLSVDVVNAPAPARTLPDSLMPEMHQVNCARDSQPLYLDPGGICICPVITLWFKIRLSSD